MFPSKERRPEWATVEGDCEWMNSLFQTHRYCCVAWGLNPAVKSIKLKARVLPHWGRGSVRPHGCDLATVTCCAFITLITHHSACMWREHCWCSSVHFQVHLLPHGFPVRALFPIRGGRKGHTVPPSGCHQWIRSGQQSGKAASCPSLCTAVPAWCH